MMRIIALVILFPTIAYCGDSMIVYRDIDMSSNNIVNISTISTKRIVVTGGLSLDDIGGIDIFVHNVDNENLTQGDCVYITTTSHHVPLVLRTDGTTGVSKKAFGIILDTTVKVGEHGKVRVVGVANSKLVGTCITGDLLRASTIGGTEEGKLVVDNSPAVGVRTWVAISTPDANGMVRTVK